MVTSKQTFLDGPPELKSPRRSITILFSDLNRSEYDFENAVLLFESLKINPVQASDPRLWAYLSHGPYYQYIMSRFKPEKNKKNYEVSNFYNENESVQKTIRNFIENRLLQILIIVHFEEMVYLIV